MDNKLISQVMQEGPLNVTLALSAADLRDFAEDIAHRVGRNIAMETVSAMKLAIGDKIEHCTSKEVLQILEISPSTLSRYKKRKYLVPCEVGGKDLYLREDVLAIKSKKP